MNFKIEINYLDISNYPRIEKHFEDMASQGWLIHRIIFESIFVYKRIEIKDLDFLISPYEVKKGDSKNTQEELEDFKSKYEAMGWNYASKSRNLHICFKEKDSESVNLEDDDKEKIELVEKLANKQLRRTYLSITFLILFTWFLLSGFIAPADFMKNTVLQVVVILIPLFLLPYIRTIVRIKQFLKLNRKNIKEGKKLKYSKANFNLEKTMFFSRGILLGIIFIYIIYGGFVLKNDIYLSIMAYISTFLVLNSIVNIIEEILPKPPKGSWILQSITFIAVLGLIFFIINIAYESNLDEFIKRYNDLDVKEYRVLSSDRPLKNGGEESKIYQNTSLIVPKSYKYDYFDKDKRVYVSTEYSNALNEDIARNLVKMYKRYAKDQLKQHEHNLDMAVESDNYYMVEEMYGDAPEDFPREKTLKDLGLSLEEFQEIDKNIRKKAVKKIIKIIEEKTISRDEENLWNLEEVYFLSYDKTEVVIRKGKEVFYLKGEDFSDPQVIKTSKNKLGL
ncbi:MAG: DUF2812 domain-containing protein [Tissierella sp.]|uniref:DUF2812 domain-containing protein n=1 Tax=Tissierella sp. TaxID=41274 RepID=UPI003F9C045C